MNRKNGFTLFELLVSISIIGILTALGVVSYSNAQKKARDSRRVQDMDAIKKAAESFYSQSPTYSYPTTVDGLVSTYLQSAPVDPKTGVAYTLTAVGGGAASGANYCVCATLEGATSGNANVATCNTFVSGGFYCVKNQQ